MATQYPKDDRHEYDSLLEEIKDLKSRVADLTFKAFELKAERDQLNIDLMRSQAQFSDSDETVRRWRTELEIVASKTDHNGCHIWIPELLRKTLGHTGNFLDPDKVTPEQFAEGCVVYHGDRFPHCGIRLAIVPQDLKDKGMLTEEQAKIARKVLGFKE